MMRSFILIKILVFNRKLQSLDLSYMSLISVPGGLPSTKLTFALILSSVSCVKANIIQKNKTVHINNWRKN